MFYFHSSFYLTWGVLDCAALCGEEISGRAQRMWCALVTRRSSPGAGRNSKAKDRFCRWVLSFPLANYGFYALCWELEKVLPWNIDRENKVNGGSDMWASIPLGGHGWLVRPGTQAVLELLGRVYAAEIKPNWDATISFGNWAQEVTDPPQLFLLRAQQCTFMLHTV